MLVDLLGKTPKIFAEVTPELLIVKCLADSMNGPVVGGSIAMAKTRPVQSLDLGVNLFSVKPQLTPSFTDDDLTGWMYRFMWVDRADWLAGDMTSQAFLVTLIKNVRSDRWSCWLRAGGGIDIEMDLPHYDVNAGVVDDTKAEAQLNPTVWNRLGTLDI